jgi:rhodanese-related sulfurtransferase
MPTKIKNSAFFPEFWPLFREAVLICLLGAALGLGVNQTLVWDVLQGYEPAAAGAPENSGEGPAFFVGRDDVIRLLEKGAVAVDARPEELFAEGHLPGAWSLPRGEVEEKLPVISAQVPLETPLVVYCSGYGCPDSEDVAMRLMDAGFVDVRVYEGGVPEWRDAGLPLAAGERP